MANGYQSTGIQCNEFFDAERIAVTEHDSGKLETGAALTSIVIPYTIKRCDGGVQHNAHGDVLIQLSMALCGFCSFPEKSTGLYPIT